MKSGLESFKGVSGFHFYSSPDSFTYGEFKHFVENVSDDFIPPFLPRFNIQECYNKWKRLAEIIIYKSQTRIAGLCCFYANNIVTREGYITFLAVDRDYRGRGIASAMLSQAEGVAFHKQMSVISIHTNNESARKLYERCGYVPQSITKIPDGEFTRYHLSKKLSSKTQNTFQLI